MSHSLRKPARRARRQLRIEAITKLEERQLLAPVVSIGTRTATFTAATTPTNPFLGTVTVAETAAPNSAAGLTSVAQLTSVNSFGGDIVRIEAGPGGDFGKGVYAISRGAGGNADPNFRDPTIVTPINRPGVIYRVDPATGKTSVFFDLNTVISQIEPGGDASAAGQPGSGLVNWYDIAFDSEGYFDGRPSMFVSSVDLTDPNKNVVYRIGPDGTFLGYFIRFSAGTISQNFLRQPSAVLVPPVEQQSFLRGLFTGNAGTGTNFVAVFFGGNSFRPGTDVNSATLPPGAFPTPLTFGPQVGLTAANTDYASPVYSAFTDFGTPGTGGVGAVPGLSGVQGLGGELLINGGLPIINSFTDINFTSIDASAAIITPFRRYQDIAFDQYGYFSYGSQAAAGALTPFPPTYQGSVFVADLATELSVDVTPVAPLPTTPPVHIPIQGPGVVGVELDPNGNVVPIITNGNSTGGSNLGGRIVRIDPNGVVTNFAENFHTNGAQDASSFINSSLSVTFSADGTTLYVADNDGIWQFKTVTSFAGSTSGTLTGLNDLRSLGVPYEGQDSAVAVVDTGVDSLTPNFRGRVAPGKNVITNGPGNDDLAAGVSVGGAGVNGHGTLIAGIVSQFVPDATIVPVNVFTPNQATAGVTGGTTPQAVYNGLNYVSRHPFVLDPVRPNQVDRVVTAALGFGTANTYDTEATAFRRYPQIVLAFKNQLHRFRKLGIAPVVAAGQFGSPTGLSTTEGDVKGMSLPAVLNEAISVTGTYPYPFATNPASPPTDPQTGVVPRPLGPVLLYNGTTAIVGGSAATVGIDTLVFKDKILNAANRGLTTDFAAPAIDVPTFRRTVSGLGPGANVWDEAGTSLSAGVVSGSFALVASALDYWTNITQNGGVTVDGYLTTPVGVNQLNFGPHQLANVSAYATPDGINSILQWTAVPAEDAANTVETVNPPKLFGNTHDRNYARVDVGNAIASIEGTIALNYLLNKGYFSVIDTNHNGMVTASEIQAFVDGSANAGLPEAGAMARLLGGTARIPNVGFQNTAVGEAPEQPDVLQRRFNFFDYAADGQLNGAVTLGQLNYLAKYLMPSPDSFTVVDRQRASNNGFLVDPQADRNISDLKHYLPKYVWVPRAITARYRNASPDRFGVGRRQLPSTIAPAFTIFDGPAKSGNAGRNSRGGRRGGGGRSGDSITGTPTTTTTKTAGAAGAQSLKPQTPISTGSTPVAASNQQATSADILKALQGLAGQQSTTAAANSATKLGSSAPLATGSASVNTSPTGTTASASAGGASVSASATSARSNAAKTSKSVKKIVFQPSKSKNGMFSDLTDSVKNFFGKLG